MTDRSARPIAVVITTPLPGPGMGRSGKELAVAAMPRTSDGLVPPPAGLRPGESALSSWPHPHTLGQQAGHGYRTCTTPGGAGPASWVYDALRGLLPDL